MVVFSTFSAGFFKVGGGGGGGGVFSSSIKSSKAPVLWERSGSWAAPGSLVAPGSLSGFLAVA